MTAASILRNTITIINLDARYYQLYARASEVFETSAPPDDWLETQGPWTYGVNQRGRATMSSPTLTIAEDGEGGIEWYIERNGMVGHGHRTSLGGGRSKLKRLAD